MSSPFDLFEENMNAADALSAVYEHLKNSIGDAVDFDDLLRSKIMYSVSAFDKLMHDLVRVKMVEIFSGTRPATPKYLGEAITLADHLLLTQENPSFPPQASFEQLVYAKLKTISYQSPDNIVGGLALIWDESQKWQKIGQAMGVSDQTIKTRIKLIVARRNAIVHEADIDPSTNQKLPISKSDADETADFLRALGGAITALTA